MRIIGRAAAIAFSMLALVLTSGVSSQAAVYHSLADYNAAVNPDFAITGTVPGSATLLDFLATTRPDSPAASLAATETFINANTTPSWNADLVWKSGNNPLGPDAKAGTLTLPFSNAGAEGTQPDAANVWVLKFGSSMIALLFSQPLTSLSFTGLQFGLSHFDLGNAPISPVPLPPAVLLFGSGLLALGLISRRKRKQVSPAQSA